MIAASLLALTCVLWVAAWHYATKAWLKAVIKAGFLVSSVTLTTVIVAMTSGAST